ncbi:MAG: DegT/DnrJ/EryC1/StrS family aminotransferase [Gemmataceae bacterium]|nr:DegT/DnrJ/EryC1/StrS family aminotransferase [Gemmataceae bacterium]
MSDLPAVLGGNPVRPQGPPAWPLADPEVFDALTRAFRDGSWGVYHGPDCAALEQALRDFFQVEHVLLCGSGTCAVELGLRALTVGAGAEVLLAAYDFPGNFLDIHAVGALPVLVDVDAANWNLAVDHLDAAHTPACKAIIASHLHGGLVAMEQLSNWARERGLAVLEDAAQCPGALVQGRPAGTWGDAGVISFGGSKLLSAGRGGALLTHRADVWQRARTHALRGNLVCPLSELQAAVVAPQLRRLTERNARRAANVADLLRLLNGVPGLQPLANPRGLGQPAYYKLGFQYDAAAFGLPREAFIAAVRAEGIALAAGFPAAHVGRSPRRFRQGTPLGEAERAHRGCIVLHHPVLLGTTAEMDEVARAIRKMEEYRDALQGCQIPDKTGGPDDVAAGE